MNKYQKQQLGTGQWNAKLEYSSFIGRNSIWKNKDSTIEVLLKDYYKSESTKAEKPQYFYWEEWVAVRQKWFKSPNSIKLEETKRLTLNNTQG